MNYWESGMDLRLGNDLYDSFKKYQSLMIEEFDKMAVEFKFEVVDARKSLEDIQDELRAKIQQLLTEEGLTRTAPVVEERAALACRASRLPASPSSFPTLSIAPVPSTTAALPGRPWEARTALSGRPQPS